MESAFDANGVINYIGTGGGQRAFSNPHDSRDVRASMSSVTSSVGCGHPRIFVQGRINGMAHNYTKKVANSWMAVDLKRFRLCPDAYCLRSDLHQGGFKLRNWRLEGSEDGEEWTTLRVSGGRCQNTDTARQSRSQRR
eukprot:2102411-Rhodomonas_salina.3